MKTGVTRLAHQYALAFYEVVAVGCRGMAPPCPSMDTALEELEEVSKVIADNKDFAAIFNHPAIPAGKKKDILVELFKKNVHESTMRLIELLADRRRLPLISHITTQYRELLRQSNQVVAADLTSAVPLSDDELKVIISGVTSKLGKKLELRAAVDPALIAGLILRVGDKVLDGSVAGRLRALEKNLLSV